MRKTFLLSLTGWMLVASVWAQDRDDVREWRSRGKTLEAMILGVEGNNVILQPYSPVKVPLGSLSEADQAFAKAWKERHQKEQELLAKARLAEIYSAEGIKPLQGNLTKLDLTDRVAKMEKYEIEKPENLRVIGYYFSNASAPNDRYLPQVNETYGRLRKRTDVFEIIYVSMDDSDKALEASVKGNGVAFPVFDFVLGRRTPFFGTIFKRVVPQLVIVDTSGKVLADSFSDQNSPPNFVETLKVLEREVRAARREVEGEADSAE